MKRLITILLCLPLIFACTKEEPFVEGEEIVLDMSVNTDDVNAFATRAMGDNVDGTPALWLVVFNSEGMLVEWAKAYGFEQTTDSKNEVTTRFKAKLHATLEGRVIHFLLNYIDDKYKDGENIGKDIPLELSSGHENNVIGGLVVERDRDVYWQRVELPNGINNNNDNTNTARNYLTKVPLVRNFSKITVTETADNFELLGFYVLNVPKYGTVAPFHNGRFVKYFNEDPPFNGTKNYTTKSYQTLDVVGGYRGAMPNVDERINKASEVTNSTELLAPTASYYLYENTYIKDDKSKTVSVLLKGKYNSTEYWYRVDFVKENTSTGVFEYFDILRNFNYNIKITHATAGKTSAKDAIEHPAGNNVLSSLDIAHLTNISDGTATLEVNHTDTVLISRDVVYVRYKFTDKGSKSDFVNNTNKDIANNGATDDCGWYLTPGDGPITVAFADNDETTGEYAGWRTVTVTVKENALKEREKVSLTLFAKSSTGAVLSRTVEYTLLPQQKMLVECPTKVPEVVGSEVNVSILIPDGLPEAMFPLEFAIEAQGTDQSGNNKGFLIQHISPDNSEVMTVKTSGSIVPGFVGKKSFQYMVVFSYQDYLAATKTTRQLGGLSVPMRVFTKKFKTNTAISASRIYAYNKYFDLGNDNFINGNPSDFIAEFKNDNTETYGVGRSVQLKLTAGEAGVYRIESATLQSPTRAILAEWTMAADEVRTIDLVTSTFAKRGQLLITCDETGISKTVQAAERKYLSAKAVSVKYNGSDVSTSLGIYRTEDEALGGASSTANVTAGDLVARTNIEMVGLGSESDLLYFSYVNENKVYIASATVQDLIAGTAVLNFAEREIVVNITDLALSGDEYYGVGRSVTFTFNTTKTGTYTITQTEGGSTKTYTHTANSTGQQTVTLTTLTWSNQLNVTVSTTVGGTTIEKSIDGDTRNKIDFGNLTLREASMGPGGGGNNVDDNTDITIKYNGNTIGTTEASKLKNGTYELECAGLSNTSQLTLSYSWYNGNMTATATAENLIKNGTTLTFNFSWQ